MKRTIRLRESELRHMIAESVKRVLRESGETDEVQEIWNTQLDEIHDFLLNEIPKTELRDFIIKITPIKDIRGRHTFNVIFKNGDNIGFNRNEYFDVESSLMDLIHKNGYTDFHCHRRFRTDKQHTWLIFSAYDYE